MDFTFTEEQQAAVEAAKAVFSGVTPDAVPSPALTPGAVSEDLDRPLWSRLAAADLLGLVVSPEHGGGGLDPVALCLVLRESARVLARVPLLETSAVAMTIERYAPEHTAAALLPRAGRGELVLTAASQGRTGHDALPLLRRPGEATGPPDRAGRDRDGQLISDAREETAIVSFREEVEARKRASRKAKEEGAS